MRTRFELVGVVLLACTALKGEAPDLNALTVADPDAVRGAVQQIRTVLKDGSAQERSTLRDLLKERLREAKDPASIGQLSIAVAPACDDECVLSLAWRLSQKEPEITTASICRSVQMLVQTQGSLKSDTKTYVAERWQALALDKAKSPRVVEAALVGLASLGSEGFDRIVSIRNTNRIGRLESIFYSLLADTGDPRALPILRAAMDEASTGDGRRAQIVRGIGQLMVAARSNGLVLSEKERSLNVAVLRGVVSADSSDQQFEAALQALGGVDGTDPVFQTAVRQALVSTIPSRREAALQALHTAEQDTDSSLLPLVTQLSQADPDDSVRDAALAVVEKSQARRGE